MTTPKMDNEDDVKRLIDIISNGDLTAAAQERLHQEGLWPLYESLRQNGLCGLCVRSPKWVGKLGRRGRDIQRPMDDEAFMSDTEYLASPS
jgi:hypothetical protein